MYLHENYGEIPIELKMHRICSDKIVDCVKKEEEG